MNQLSYRAVRPLEITGKERAIERLFVQNCAILLMSCVREKGGARERERESYNYGLFYWGKLPLKSSLWDLKI